MNLPCLAELAPHDYLTTRPCFVLTDISLMWMRPYNCYKDLKESNLSVFIIIQRKPKKSNFENSQKMNIISFKINELRNY